MAAGAGLLVGLALGGLLQVYSGARDASLPSVPLDAEPGSDASARDLEALRAALAAERTERLALGVEVARLRSVLEQLASESEEGEAVPGGGASQAQPGGAADLPAPSEVAAAEKWFDESALLDRGIPPDEVARLNRLFQESEMEVLYLRDRATREGGGRHFRMMNELADLRARLREEVGDEDYDLVLWATGQENRVIITDVLLTSPARAADLRSGDVIVRYGDEKIFSVSDLQHATRGGEVGDPVTVEVLRGDQELRTYLPRGPLGVRLQSARREPDTRR
jgi:hypothetical protein